MVPSLVVVIPSIVGLIHRSVAADDGIISLVSPELSTLVSGGGVTLTFLPYSDYNKYVDIKGMITNQKRIKEHTILAVNSTVF